jgi:hypothetical protein
MGGPVDPPSLLRAAPPSRFEVRVTAVALGRMLAHRDSDWRDALVVVEQGAIDLEWLGGARQRFGCGAVLWLAGLPPRAVGNRRLEPPRWWSPSRAAVPASDRGKIHMCGWP